MDSLRKVQRTGILKRLRNNRKGTVLVPFAGRLTKELA
jgi:hypothetical protein